MPTLTKQTSVLGLFKTLRALGAGKAIGWASQIIFGSPEDPGEDLYSVVNRKLESSGVIASGTADPVFASETALLYHQTTDNLLFVRGSTDYTEVEAAPDYAQTRVVYNPSATRPASSPNVSWNHETGVFTLHTAGGWTQTRAGAVWYVQLICPGDSNTVIQLNFERVDGSLAEDIGYSPENTSSTFLPGSVDSVEDALDGLDTQVKTLTDRPSGGTVTPQAIDWDATSGWYITNKPTIPSNAGQIATTTTGWGQNIPTSATNVQTALNALNSRDIQLYQEETFGQISGTITNTGIRRAFTLDPSLVLEYRTRFDDPLFIEAHVEIEVQNDGRGRQLTAGYVFDVVDSSGAALTPPIQSEVKEVTTSGNIQYLRFRVAGTLPNSITGGSVRMRRTTGSTEVIAGIQNGRIAITGDLKADEVTVDQSGFTGHLSTGHLPSGTANEDVQDFLEIIDGFAVQPSYYASLSWPAAPNGIDDDATEVRRTVSIPLSVRNVNDRPGHHYVGIISYKSSFHDRALGATDVDFSHNVYTNLSNTAISTQSITGQGTMPTERTVEVDIPNGATQVIVGFTVPSGQQDARLVVTDYRVDLVEGIDSSGFTTSGRIISNNVRTPQSLAQAVYDYVPGAGGTDDQNASEVPVVISPTNPFLDPNTFPGGIRGVTYTGYESNPNDVRAALRSVDSRLNDAYNPFIGNETLDFDSGAGFTETATVSGTVVLSEPVDLPEYLRDFDTDIDTLLRMEAQTVPSGWTGTIHIVNEANTSTFGLPPINVTNANNGDHIVMERTIPRLSVPSTYRYRFTRTAGTGSATFRRGHAFFRDSIGSTGGAGGASNYSETIIWTAGLSASARLTANSDTTVRPLLSGHSWADYDQLLWHFDTGTDAGMIVPVMIPSADFRAATGLGMLNIFGTYWILVKVSGTTGFTYRWNAGGNVGIRRVVGINY